MATFVDANVVIHATGTDAKLRALCGDICRDSALSATPLVTSAEVLQEILWVRQRTRGLESARLALRIAMESFQVVPLLPADVVRSAGYGEIPGLQARDRVHLAVMERLGISRIISTDRAFDLADGITRLDPADFLAWRTETFAGNP